MPETFDNGLGCLLEPPALGAPNIDLMLGDTPLPEEYIIPSWRECFDAVFHPIASKIRPRILNQGAIDSCVGHATSVQKTAQEKVLISPRDIFRIAKTLDGYGLSAYGTTLGAGQDAVIKGAAEDALVPRDPAMGRTAYISQADVTPAVVASREKHKGRSSFFVPRMEIQRVLFEMKIPVVTSCMWYKQDSALGAVGLMALPETDVVAGHAFAVIGWVMRDVGVDFLPCLVAVNSFGPDWGANGLFFIPLRDVVNRLSNAYIAIDFPPDLAAILAQYNGRDVIVRGGAAHWRIEDGKKRRYPNEIVWWANGKLFGFDVYEIDSDDLDTIPLGEDMTLEGAPFATRELVRQIRQYFGAL